MGTGKKNNIYYKDYDGMAKVHLVYEDETGGIIELEIWEGYFLDILDEPDLSGNGWKGFTRDYHQCEGIWDSDGEFVTIKAKEYISDLKFYDCCDFDYPETRDVVECVCSFLQDAVNVGTEVKACIED